VLSAWLPQIDLHYDDQIRAHRLFGPVNTMAVNTMPVNAFAVSEASKLQLSELQKERIHLRELHAFVKEAQKLDAPRRFVEKLVPDKWEAYARLWIEYFERWLPGRPAAASYRFVEQMAPIITKDKPTYESVRTFIMRNRPVTQRERKKKV
jgi:hypothetical protein